MDARLPTAAEQRAEAIRLREKFYPATPRNIAPAHKTQPSSVHLEKKIERLEQLAETLIGSVEDLMRKLENAVFVQTSTTLREQVEAIAAPIAKKHGVTFADVTGGRRLAHIVMARRDVWKAVYEGLPMYGTEDLGEILNCSGSTIRHQAKADGWAKRRIISERFQREGQ